MFLQGGNNVQPLLKSSSISLLKIKKRKKLQNLYETQLFITLGTKGTQSNKTLLR